MFGIFGNRRAHFNLGEFPVQAGGQDTSAGHDDIATVASNFLSAAPKPKRY